MELLYLWIDYYKNIRQKGFNFSPQYDIYYEDKQPLKIRKRTSVHANFFNEKFLNITTIIGENGSGKTSLLEFIEYFFIQDYNVNYSCLLLVNDNTGKLILYNGIYNPEGLEIIADGISYEIKKVKDLNDFSELWCLNPLNSWTKF
jgi:hypothetical protein